LAAASADLKSVVEFIAANGKSNVKAAFAGSVPYLKIAGIVFGGWQMARAAMAANTKLAEGSSDATFYKSKVATARFFADHSLTTSSAARIAIVEGSAGVLALADEHF
jgi:butyryl-CoA dehydrogenase